MWTAQNSPSCLTPRSHRATPCSRPRSPWIIRIFGTRRQWLGRQTTITRPRSHNRNWKLNLPKVSNRWKHRPLIRWRSPKETWRTKVRSSTASRPWAARSIAPAASRGILSLGPLAQELSTAVPLTWMFTSTLCWILRSWRGLWAGLPSRGKTKSKSNNRRLTRIRVSLLILTTLIRRWMSARKIL